jgi:hypothetical protein
MAARVRGASPQTGAGVIKRLMCFLVGEAWAESAIEHRLVTSVVCALFAQVNSGEPLPSPWRQGRSDLADAYMRIGHRWRMWLSPECRGQRLRKKESGNRQSHGPGPMSIKELARRRHRKILCTAQLVSAREIRVRLQ